MARRHSFDSLVLPAGAARLVLAQQGVALDTVAAVRNTLNSLGVPLTSSAIPSRLVNQGFSVSDVIDYAPTATTSLRFSHNGNWQGSVSDATTASAYPTRANEQGFRAQQFTLKASGYVKGLLNELTAAHNAFNDHNDPYVRLPSASVRVGTVFADGRTGVSNLQFGGGTGTYYWRTTGSELIDELSWLPKSGSHRLKVGGRYSAERSDFYMFEDQPLLGRYTYLTMADLAANKPATYDRLLNTSARRTKAVNSALWIGDEWTVSKSWQLQTGLRADFSNPETRPAYNRAADSVFGIRTDRIPNDVGLARDSGSPGRRRRGSARAPLGAPHRWAGCRPLR